MTKTIIFFGESDNLVKFRGAIEEEYKIHRKISFVNDNYSYLGVNTRVYTDPDDYFKASLLSPDGAELGLEAKYEHDQWVLTLDFYGGGLPGWTVSTRRFPDTPDGAPAIELQVPKGTCLDVIYPDSSTLDK